MHNFRKDRQRCAKRRSLTGEGVLGSVSFLQKRVNDKAKEGRCQPNPRFFMDRALESWSDMNHTTLDRINDSDR